MSRRKTDTRAHLEALHAASADPHSSDTAETVRQALQSRSGPAIDRAARLVGEHRLHALEPDLLAVYPRLFIQPIQRDPGCGAKQSIALALDLLDHMDAAPFLRGARWRQPEPAWGGAVDTAVGLRARCGHALVRMGWPDALGTLADLLADPEARVREEAARALGNHGSDGAAAVLRYAVGAITLHGLVPPMEEAAVVEATFHGLAAIDLDAALEALAPHLAAGPWSTVALFALAESRSDRVVPLLADVLDRSVGPEDQEAALTALAIHRTEASRQVLLEVIADGPPRRSRLAVSALAVQAADARFGERVRAAAAELGDPRLDARVEEVFGAGDG